MPKPQTDLLNGLSEEEARRLVAVGVPVAVPAGGVLFHLGDHANRVYNVVRGRITLTLPMQVRGSEEDVLIEERLAGETLGWSGLIPPHRFTLKATAPVESEVIAFSREALLGHFAANPAVGYTVTRNVAAVIGHRLQVFQTMWLREMQRVIETRYS
jgi:CRP/FNR family cyclic AMP-dependent transcriptional regulator